MGRGGIRHTKKPEVDVGLLLEVLNCNKTMLRDLGPYEQISRTQSCHAKGLLKCLPLIKGLIELEPTAEIHSQSIRSALMQLLVAQPTVNDTKWSGSVWCGLKVERVGVLLNHMRRLRSPVDMKTCAAHLTGNELVQLQDVVNMIAEKNTAGSGTIPTQNSFDGHESPERAGKRLKKEVSDASLDSNGFPNCLKSPPPSEKNSPLQKGNGTSSLAKGDAQPLAQPSFIRRRPGQTMAQDMAAEAPSRLQEDLGFVGKKPASKKAKGKKKPCQKDAKGAKNASPAKQKDAGGAKSASPAQPTTPWTRITMTKTAKKPWRAYICGSTKEGALVKDCRLIVETTYTRHPKYLEILEDIKKKVMEENLTKEQALELREKLYNTY